MPKLSLNASKKTKQTAAGEIPVDWECAKLERLIDKLEAGVSVSGSDRPAARNEQGVLKVSAVSDGRFLPDENKAIETSEILRARLRPRVGAILVSRSNSPELVGESALIKETPGNLFLPDKLWQVRLLKNANASEEWLSQVLRLPTIRLEMRNRASGTSQSMKNISKSAFLGIHVALPPLPEQRKIADILTTWDEALEKLDALIAAKDRRKKALMLQLLTGRKRVAGATGEWRTTTLAQVLEPTPRPTPKPSKPFLAAGIRSHGRGVFLKPDFIPADIALDELYEIKSGDLIVNITFAWEGAAAIVSDEADGALVSHRFPTFSFRAGKASRAFFRHYIRTKRFVFDCGLASPGGAGRNRVLSKTAFLKIGLMLPPIEEQEAIGEILDTCDAELTLLRRQRDALDLQKRGLMQRLLTGKIRVAVDEPVASP
ncbi:restriction endonuclease subunit S [Haloferula sp. A504]|uniref:restriction endonuclease subunit S n=1 Tax=Haloferula sp. A504 TaxID=3373601 RepID=UPI0031C68484|nr:restriction endonuclease subunit S [Verrucomicrobiaceae bacterium E54]